MMCNLAIVDFGNRILNTLNGIKSLLQVSALYIIQVIFPLVLTSDLVKIADFTVSKFKYLTFTKSKFLAQSSYYCTQGSSSCQTSWTTLIFVVITDLVSAFVYFCIPP